MAIDLWGVAPLLQVFDMPASIAFYTEVLAFEVTSTSGGPVETWGFAWLRRDGVDLMLNTAYDEGERPAVPDPARVAAHGDTILYFGCRDLDGAYQHLLAKGMSVKPPMTQRYGMRQLYVRDPDGYGLCFQWPANEEMREQWRKAYRVEL